MQWNGFVCFENHQRFPTGIVEDQFLAGELHYCNIGHKSVIDIGVERGGHFISQVHFKISIAEINRQTRIRSH